MDILLALLKESINELTGLNLGHLVRENRTCAKNWPLNGGLPESGTLAVPDLGQYLACSGLLRLNRSAQACTTTSSGYLVTAQV
jgi:hypothetical protein